MKNSTRYLLSHLATRLGIAALYSSMHLHPAGCEMPPVFPAFIWRPRRASFLHRAWQDGDPLGKVFLK